ncbi:MAG: response regulator transcription factor [Bacteroidota bacterium]
MKLLVIEDEKELSDSICSYLNSAHFICETAYNFPAAMEKIALHDYTCIILDITLPGGSGLDILKELRSNNKADAVLVISARNSLDDKVHGLRAGADDYLTKPFHLPELMARIEAIIRRKVFMGKSTIEIGNLSLNIQDKTAMAGGQTLNLTRMEYDLLLYFVGNKNRVVSKNAMSEHVWGDQAGVAGNFDFLYAHIKNLRKKLLHAGCPDYIESVYGIGYKFSI